MIKESLREGWAAAKKNLLPGLLLQALMVAFFSLYVSHEGTRKFLSEVAHWKQEAGFAFAFVAYAFAGALLPELLKIGFFQDLKIRRGNVKMFLISAPFWGFFGVLVDALYRGQVWMFGNAADIPTIAAKLAVDQFLFSPFLGAPLTVLYFAWAARGFRLSRLREAIGLPTLVRRVFGIQCAAWMIWIPGVCLVYAMPELLQVPVAVLISAFWVLVFTALRERQMH